MSEKRSKKLIEPRLQMRFSLAFLTTALVLVLVQAIVTTYILQDVALELPHDSAILQRSLPKVLLTSFAVTFLFLAPLSLAIGISTTFRVLGPLHRFRIFLRQVANGEKPGPCAVRESDELQDFCELLNEVTAPLRSTEAETTPEREAA